MDDAAVRHADRTPDRRGLHAARDRRPRELLTMKRAILLAAFLLAAPVASAQAPDSSPRPALYTGERVRLTPRGLDASPIVGWVVSGDSARITIALDGTS